MELADSRVGVSSALRTMTARIMLSAVLKAVVVPILKTIVI